MKHQHRTNVGIRQFEKKKPKGFGFYLFEAGSIIATAAVTLGVVILCWQGFTWQQTGTWHGVNLLNLLEWAGYPLNGYDGSAELHGGAGLFQLLLSLPAFVTVPACGFAFFIFTSFFSRSGR